VGAWKYAPIYGQPLVFVQHSPRKVWKLMPAQLCQILKLPVHKKGEIIAGPPAIESGSLKASRFHWHPALE
jgi:hypothetical protein